MNLIESLAATYAAVGQDITDLGLETVAADLQAYALADVQYALSRCRKELRRIALTDILERLPNQHPGAEEAWAQLAPALGNEHLTLIWTTPMRLAFGIAANLEDDPVAARMAFKAAYTREIAAARERGEPPTWEVSPGRDPIAREHVIRQAVTDGKLPTIALMQLPNYQAEQAAQKKLLPNFGKPARGH